jgi:hypothetical protein
MINLSFETVDEINIILASLSERPYRQVSDLIENIRIQTMGQLQPASEVEESSDSAD